MGIYKIDINSLRETKFERIWNLEIWNFRWDDIGKECGPTFGFADLNDGGLVLFRLKIKFVKILLRYYLICLSFSRYLVLKMKSKLKGIVHPPQVGRDAFIFSHCHTHSALKFSDTKSLLIEKVQSLLRLQFVTSFSEAQNVKIKGRQSYLKYIVWQERIQAGSTAIVHHAGRSVYNLKFIFRLKSSISTNFEKKLWNEKLSLSRVL